MPNEIRKPNEFSSTDSMAKERNKELERKRIQENLKGDHVKNQFVYDFKQKVDEYLIPTDRSHTKSDISNPKTNRSHAKTDMSYKDSFNYNHEQAQNTDRDLNIYSQDDINRNNENNQTLSCLVQS